MEKIDLEEIWDKIQIDFDNGDKTIRELGKQAMLNFGMHLLKLASNNADIDKCLPVDEDNKVYVSDISINKQSILDTINQVE